MDYFDADRELHHKGHGGRMQSRKVANNTWLERRGHGYIALRLHATNVAEFFDDGSVVLNSGGWRTMTTKDRINRFVGGWVLFSARHHRRAGSEWWLLPFEPGRALWSRPAEEWVPFFEGIHLDQRDGTVRSSDEEIEWAWEQRQPEPTKRERINSYMSFMVDPDQLARFGQEWEVNEARVVDDYADRAIDMLLHGSASIGVEHLLQAKHLNVGVLTKALELDAAVRGEWDRSPAHEAIEWAEIMAEGKEPPRFRSTLRRLLSYYYYYEG